jgi:hypothetical protein
VRRHSIMVSDLRELEEERAGLIKWLLDAGLGRVLVSAEDILRAVSRMAVLNRRLGAR